MALANEINISTSQINENSVKLYSKNRDLGYYYDNLCLYFSVNGLQNNLYSDDELMNAAEMLELYGNDDNSIEHFYFWI